MRALLIPIGLVSIIGVAASVACSASVTIGSSPPPTTFFVGPDGNIDFGAACEGQVYYADGSGAWAYCDSGFWAYTTDDPASDGYTEFGGGDDGGSGEAGSGEAGSGEAGSGEAGSGEAGSGEAGSGDDTGSGGDDTGSGGGDTGTGGDGA